jgi:hypothetical protein
MELITVRQGNVGIENNRVQVKDQNTNQGWTNEGKYRKKSASRGPG